MNTWQEAIDKIVWAQAEAVEKVILNTIQTSREAIIVNTDQKVDHLWLGDREVVRSPHVPLGTGYEYDPAILDFRGGLR